MSTLAFDPAKKTGYAFRAGRLWHTGVVDPRNHAAVLGVCKQAILAGVKLALIEDCYVSQKAPEPDPVTGKRAAGGGNVKTLKSLQDKQTRVTVACELAGLQTELTYPVSWQSAFNIRGKREERKRHAKLIAERIAGRKLTQDEADAVLIAEYGNTRARQLELEVRAK